MTLLSSYFRLKHVDDNQYLFPTSSSIIKSDDQELLYVYHVNYDSFFFELICLINVIIVAPYILFFVS